MGFQFTKVDDEKHLVGGVVYQPDVEDAQGDWTDSEEIYKGMESFMLGGAVLKVMHKDRTFECKVVECFQPEVNTLKGGETIPAGCWWLCIKVQDRELWRKIKSGQLTGFSMAGHAKSIIEEG